MKRLLKKGIDLFSFGRIAEMDHIESRFSAVHNRKQQQHPHWSGSATRQILISDYRFAVFKHFWTVVLLPLVIYFASVRAFNAGTLIVVSVICLTLFGTLYIWLYRSTYYLSFLPHLEAVTARYHNAQQQAIINQLREQLAEQQKKEQQKRDVYQKELVEREKQLTQMEKLLEEENECRKTQLPTFTLVLIFHTIHKALLNSNLTIDAETTGLLNQLFGRSIGSLREPIEIINGVSSKRAKVEKRKASEIQNRFDEARAFFTAINYTPAIETLHQLEERIFTTPPKKEKP